MTTRIEVATKVFDTRAAVRQKKLSDFTFSDKIKDLFLLDVYTIDKQLSTEELNKIGSALANPVTQAFYLRTKSKDNRYAKNKKFSWAIEVGFLPGVTDNISHTAKEIAEDLLKIKFTEGENIYTSQITFITGDLSQDEVQQAAESLYNPIIQRVNSKSYQQFIKDGGMDIIVPQVKLTQTTQTIEVNLDVPEEELEKIGKAGIANSDGTRRGPLALTLLYMKTIQKYFKKLGRNPTDIELESIAQTWSEHCKHTIFNDPIDDIKDGLFKTYIRRATEEIRRKRSFFAKASPSVKTTADKSADKVGDFCVSVFTDNSGGIAFDDEYVITHKVETHNSPSALDPFGGAVTGIVGVHRDALGFGLGARPVANIYGFCLADPRLDTPLYKGPNFTQKMLSSRRIMDGVIEGVNAGGNQSGIPTPQGFLYFDERYRGKPLVFCGTIGLIPKTIQGKQSHSKRALPGDYVVVIGGRVGKDGIHGATFSSEEMDSGSPRTAVQIGDPITQKKLSDAIVYEARDQLLYNSITDNGAGGISCSVAEMAKESNGCIVQLEKVPLKYPGMQPWEIWISESQERMTLAVPKEKWKTFKNLMQRRGVEATVIGEYTDSGKCVVTYNGKTIMNLDLEFLHNGLPKRSLVTKELRIMNNESRIEEPKDQIKLLHQILSRLNITSFEFISQQYDYIVQGNSALGPLHGRGRINADTSVIRPVLSSKKGVILSQSLYPSYSERDPYSMAAASIDTAIRNVVAAGGNPDYIALLDNYCWCSPLEPERLGQLKNSAKACYDYAVAYGTPFISGKDSMYNDFNGYDKNGKAVKISIPPTLLISSIGVVNDITKIVSLDAKMPGDLVYILGETFDEMGGSEYDSFCHSRAPLEKASPLGKGGNPDPRIHEDDNVPQVDAEKNKKLYDAYYQCTQKGLIASAQSIARGGLGIALAKTAMGGMLGVEISLKNLPGKISRDDFALYSESQGRIVVTVALENKKEFEKILKGNAFREIGKVIKEQKFIVRGLKGKKIINTDIESLLKAYRETFKGY